MAHDVFISYSSQDEKTANAICTTLESMNIRCWVAPRDIPPGAEWAETIVDAINESRIFVLVLSSSSNNSPQVKREVERAASKGIPIIPIRIDNVTPSKEMELFVAPSYWLDASEPPLEKHLLTLADMVQALLTHKKVRKEESIQQEYTFKRFKRGKSKSVEDVVAKTALTEAKLRKREESLKFRMEKHRQEAKESLKSGNERDAKIALSKCAVLQAQINSVSPMIELAEVLKGTVEGQKDLKDIADIGMDLVEVQKEIGFKPKEMEKGIIAIKAATEKVSSAFDELSKLMEGLTTTPEVTKEQETLRAELIKEIELERAKEAELEKKITEAERDSNVIAPLAGTYKGIDGEIASMLKSTLGRQGGSPEVPGGRVDLVHFSVTSPSTVQPSYSFRVGIWAHLEKQRREVIQRAMEAAKEEEISITTQGPMKVEHGTVLTVRLKLEEFIVEPSEATILWEGEIGNTTFGVRVPKDAKKGRRVGIATIHQDGFQVAIIFFELDVGRKSTAVGQIKARVKHHRTAFASYASPDRGEVMKRIQGMQKASPELDIFVDVDSLRSGQYWEWEIRKIIRSRDVFYLFWSASASKSYWVDQEWRYALEKRGLHFIDPCPLVSPKEVPPPKELESLHFNDRWIFYEESTVAK